jgi:beta-lactamase regulating signal transducer with metallopeptidase domain
MLFPYLIKVSLLLGGLTLGYRWLIQFESFSKVNRALLWLNVAAAWLLPLIPLAEWGPVEVQQEFHQTLPELVRSIPVATRYFLLPPAATSPILYQSATGWQISDWLLLVYGIGLLLMTGRFLYRLSGLLLSLRNAPAEPLGEGILLVCNEQNNSPYSFFRWIVCNPDSHSDDALQQILAHESEHVRQWHSADLLLAELQRIALWFNPFSWVHQRLVQGNLEFLADRAVLEHGYEKKQYQLNLLKTALQTNELPLTNSFAQSLLKKRIKMMNRRPSPYWVWGKYAFLLSTLYLSSAFVAPYKHQIVEITPEVVKPLVSALVEEALSEPGKTLKESILDPKAIENIEPDSLSQEDMDTVKYQPKKWVLVRGDTLYWAVPARATLSDLNSIQEGIKSFGSEMTINSFKYDPLQLFLTSLTLKIKQKGGSGTIDAGVAQYSPIKGCSGYITKSGGLGMGQTPPTSLQKQLQQDYQEANGLKQQNSTTYARDSLEQVLKKNGGSYGNSTYLKKYLEGSYANTILREEGIGKSESNTLLLTELVKSADFLLDGTPSTFEKLNQLPFHQFDNVTILKAQNGQKFISVFTR